MHMLYYYIILLCSLSSLVTPLYSIPGIAYRHVLSTHPVAQSIHILAVNPHKAQISLALANNQCESADTTSHIAQQHQAYAAINAGFFDFGVHSTYKEKIIRFLDLFGLASYNAFPVYSLKIDNSWCSLSNVVTGAIGWTENGQQVVYDTLKTTAMLTINDQSYPIADFNKPARSGTIVYLPNYAPNTPRYLKRSTEIIVRNGYVTKIINNSRGKTLIPADGFVCRLHNATNTVSVALNDPVNFYTECADIKGEKTTHKWHTMSCVLASTPLLITQSVIVPDLYLKKTSFYTQRHPRSAVGIQDNGTWIFVVVEGRHATGVGFTIVELAAFMRRLGCTYALNLDGGGSSTMVLDNKIVNYLSGREHALIKKERAVSNAFIIKPLLLSTTTFV